MRMRASLLSLGVLFTSVILTTLPGSNGFTSAGSLTLNGGESNLLSAVIDSAGGYAYFGTGTSPGMVVKVRLSDFTRVGSLTLNSGENFLDSAVIDAAGGYAYFGTGTSPGIVVKIRLSNFTRVGGLTLNSGESDLRSAVIDAANGFAYFGTATSPGVVVKIQLSDFTRVGALTLNTGENNLYSAVIDTANGFAYFGTITGPGIVVKVRLSDLTRVGALTLHSGESYLRSAVIDTTNGYAYFGTETSLAVVVKVRLSDLTEVGSLTLESSVGNLASAVIDVANGYAYFGTWSAPGIVVKFRLSDLACVGTLNLSTGEDNLLSAVIDPANRFAYFGTYWDFPGVVVKVAIEDPPLAPASLTATGGPGEVSLAWSAPACDGGAPIIGYRIYRGLSLSGESFLTTVGVQTSYVDADVSPGVSYYYRVTAVNDVGEGGYSMEASATPQVTVPSAPRNLEVALTTSSNGSPLLLRWSPPSNNVGMEVGYKIYRGTASGEETLLASEGYGTTFADSTANPGTTYYYFVKATNSAGDSPASNEVSAEIPIFSTVELAVMGIGAVAIIVIALYFLTRRGPQRNGNLR